MSRTKRPFKDLPMDLPEVPYEMCDDGIMRAIDPAAARVDHLVMYNGGPLAILRNTTAPRTLGWRYAP